MSVSGYSDQDRAIYGPFFTGTGAAYGDPIRIRRLLSDLLDGDPKKALENMHSPLTELRVEAVERVLRATVQAFELVPFDKTTGQGLREDEVLARLNDFLSWWSELKKNSATSRISAPPTAPASSAGNPTTSPSAASGLTSPVSAWPLPSPSPAG